MKDKRPVNLDIGSFHLPLTSYTSITHRITGVILFVGIAILLWLLDRSLASPAGFDSLRESLLVKLLLWGVLSALAFHTVAGVRHLLMDVGVGESKTGGFQGARATIVISLILIVFAGVWVW